jgi:hypothetical protein
VPEIVAVGDIVGDGDTVGDVEVDVV